MSSVAFMAGMTLLSPDGNRIDAEACAVCPSAGARLQSDSREYAVDLPSRHYPACLEVMQRHHFFVWKDSLEMICTEYAVELNRKALPAKCRQPCVSPLYL